MNDSVSQVPKEVTERVFNNSPSDPVAQPYFYTYPTNTPFHRPYTGPICGTLNNCGYAPGAGIHIRILNAEFIVDQWRIGCVYSIESPHRCCRAFLTNKSPESLEFLTVSDTGDTETFTITAKELCEEPNPQEIAVEHIAYGSGYYPPRPLTNIYPVFG